MARGAAELDERQRAKPGLASNFAAPNFEKRQQWSTAKFVACTRFASPVP